MGQAGGWRGAKVGLSGVVGDTHTHPARSPRICCRSQAPLQPPDPAPPRAAPAAPLAFSRSSLSSSAHSSLWPMPLHRLGCFRWPESLRTCIPLCFQNPVHKLPLHGAPHGFSLLWLPELLTALHPAAVGNPSQCFLTNTMEGFRGWLRA